MWLIAKRTRVGLDVAVARRRVVFNVHWWTGEWYDMDRIVTTGLVRR